jgi:hypothetical protein
MAGAEFIQIFKMSECHVTYCVTEPSSDLKLEGTLQRVGDHDAYSNVVTTYVFAPHVLTLFVDLLYFQVNITFYDPFIELQATDVCLQSLALLQPGNVDLSVAGSMILRYRPADNECHEAAVVSALLLLMSLLWTYCMEYYDTVTALNATERVEKEEAAANEEADHVANEMVKTSLSVVEVLLQEGKADVHQTKSKLKTASETIVGDEPSTRDKPDRNHRVRQQIWLTLDHCISHRYNVRFPYRQCNHHRCLRCTSSRGVGPKQKPRSTSKGGLQEVVSDLQDLFARRWSCGM